jgi:ribonuclease HII
LNKKEELFLFMRANSIEAGCDEAGRGCLAGPVFAAAVILRNDFECKALDDSKLLSEKQRDELRSVIESNAICYSVASCTTEEIDSLNILWASVKAMHKALSSLSIQPNHIIVDGNKFSPYNGIEYRCVVKGDSKYQSIAAASILAKTYRDEYMKNLDKQFPEYDWAKNKGYPTKKHREAIKLYGITEHHRKSFNLLEHQFELNFSET